jgi:hypothetical protein
MRPYQHFLPTMKVLLSLVKLAVNWNMTIDDFDSMLTWETPDLSAAGFDPSTSPWLSGTYHNTMIIGASMSLNITGN